MKITSSLIFPKASKRIREHKEALEFWNYTVPLLIESKTIKNIDLHILEACAMSWYRYINAEHMVDEKGLVQIAKTGYENISPFVILQDKFLNQFIKLAESCGLNPRSRARMKINDEDEEEDDGNKIKQFIR